MLQQELSNRLGSSPFYQPTSVALLDLERFQNLNDSLGHIAGDQLLKAVAGRLKEAVSPPSMLFRLGGDEFIVLTNADNAEAARFYGRFLTDLFRDPFQIGEHTLCCRATIGMVMADGIEDVDDLLRSAERALSEAKRSTRGDIPVLDASDIPAMRRRWRMASDLRLSVELCEIEVVYQPIVDLSSLRLSGMEALARWSHPVHGPISPSEFIPLAEDAGLIASLGQQVMRKACREIAAWNRKWGIQLQLNVNLSPRQFAEGDLLAGIMSVLHEEDLNPNLLTLEITESAFLVQQETMKAVLENMRSAGISISLDDFGTGYSSLSFLLDLPTDEVKIDRRFIAEMRQNAGRRKLVSTVIELAHSLGKRVVAEGIEHPEDLAILRQMGCELVQGWFLSRPLTAVRCEAFLPALLAGPSSFGLQLVATDSGGSPGGSQILCSP